MQRRATRREEAAFAVEGPTLVVEALHAGLELLDVFVGDGLDPDDDRAAAASTTAAIARLTDAGIEPWSVATKALAQAVDVVTPRPIVAIVRRPDPPADALDADLVLVLAGIADPGNAGTLLRVAEAAGVGAVAFGDGSVDPFAPKTVRAAAGALFRVPVVDRGSTVQTLEGLAKRGHRVVATRAGAPTAYDELDCTAPTAFVLGNEAHGLPAEVDEHVTDIVSIPMAGRVESLNVAMAGSVLCFEALRQRRARAEAKAQP